MNQKSKGALFVSSLSFVLLPGLGYLYLKKYRLGFLFIGVYFASLVLSIFALSLVSIEYELLTPMQRLLTMSIIWIGGPEHYDVFGLEFVLYWGVDFIVSTTLGIIQITHISYLIGRNRIA